MRKGPLHPYKWKAIEIATRDLTQGWHVHGRDAPSIREGCGGPARSRERARVQSRDGVVPYDFSQALRLAHAEVTERRVVPPREAHTAIVRVLARMSVADQQQCRPDHRQ
jgi:hypothetical protein